MGWFGSYVVFMQAIGTWMKELSLSYNYSQLENRNSICSFELWDLIYPQNGDSGL